MYDFEEAGARALALAEELSYVREAGSEAERRAAGRLADELRSGGLSSALEPFSFRTRVQEAASLFVLAPYEKEYPVSAYLGAGDTEPDGLRAPFVYVEDGDEVSLSLAHGCIAMRNGHIGPEEYQRLLEAGAAAFLSVGGTPVDEGEDRRPVDRELRRVRDARLPGANLHCLDARELLERGAARARLLVRQKDVTRRSQNVAARIPGRERPDEVVCLSAHVDSVPAGPGAYDDLAGALIAAEAARYFSRHPLRRSVQICLFGAEEKGLRGSLAFAAAHGAELDKYYVNLNVDLAGQPIGGTVLGVTADGSLCRALEEILRRERLGAAIQNKVWASDSNVFALHGVPALTLDRDGYGMHTRRDTADLLSAWALSREIRLLTALAEGLDALPDGAFARALPGEMKKTLEDYFAD
jgi:aminopeptidase YwaD